MAAAHRYFGKEGETAADHVKIAGGAEQGVHALHIRVLNRNAQIDIRAFLIRFGREVDERLATAKKPNGSPPRHDSLFRTVGEVGDPYFARVPKYSVVRATRHVHKAETTADENLIYRDRERRRVAVFFSSFVDFL